MSDRVRSSEKIYEGDGGSGKRCRCKEEEKDKYKVSEKEVREMVSSYMFQARRRQADKSFPVVFILEISS